MKSSRVKKHKERVCVRRRVRSQGSPAALVTAELNKRRNIAEGLCITVYFETRMGIAAGYSVLLFITTGLRCLGSRGQRNVGHMTQRCSYTGRLGFERLIVQLDNGE